MTNDIIDPYYKSSSDTDSEAPQQNTPTPHRQNTSRKQITSSPLPQEPITSNSQDNGIGTSWTDYYTSDDGTLRLPSQRMSYKANDFLITAMTLTTRGHRLATGDLHGDIRVWDLNSLDTTGNRYQSFLPTEGHGVDVLEWSVTGQHLLVSCGDRWLQIISGSLEPVITTYKGDMYVRDMANTQGHTHQVYDAQWHPNDLEKFASSGLDGTVRLWDLNSKPVGLDQALPSILVMKTTNKRGVAISQDCAVHSLTFIDANNIAGACADGSVQLWDSRTNGVKARKSRATYRDEGQKGAAAVVYARSTQQLYVRSEAAVTHLDPRKLSEHIKRVDIISSDQKRPQLKTLAFGGLLVTTAAGMEDVHYLDARNLDVIHSVSSGQPALTSLVCHDTLKQIILGSSSGEVVGLFDQELSFGGLKDVGPAAVAEVEPSKLEGVSVDASFSWYDLPSNVKQLRDGSIREIKPKRHILRTKANPAIPLTEQGAGADPVMKKTIAQSVMKDFLQAEAADRGGDDDNWIERLRGEPTKPSKYSLVDRAYRETQPEPVFDDTEIIGGEAMLMGQRKCPQCGLKMCTCGYMTMIRGRLEAQAAAKKPRVGN